MEADQREDQQEEPADLQVQEIREAKQRFLQKLANQIQRDHLENEKLHFLVRQHLVEESATIWSGPAEPEKEEEQKGHQATRTASFLPGSFAVPSDGKAASNDANSNTGVGPRLETSGSPAIASAAGPKPAQSSTTQNPSG